MIYETYTCGEVGGTLEFGYCFVGGEGGGGGDDDGEVFDVVLGELHIDYPDRDAVMQKRWADYEWVAKAIVAAAPPPPPPKSGDSPQPPA